MDLEDMKAGWNVLNERLAQNEILNQRIIKEMIITRTKSAYEKIYAYGWKDLFITLFVGIILFPGIMFFSEHPMAWTTFILGEVILLWALVIYVLSVYCLSKFKLGTSTTTELLRVVMKYKRLCWYSKVYGSALAICFFVNMWMEGVFTNIYVIVTTAVMLGFGLLFSLAHLRWHDGKLKEVEQGLAELKEFEE
ncbi:hypothetical protein [Phocaeicola sp.]